MTVNHVSFAAPTLQALKRLDRDNNGVSVSELKTLDSDNDGTINQAEATSAGIDSADVQRINQTLQAHASEPNLVVFGSKFMVANEARQQMLNVFQRVDGDNDGFLSKSELNTALHSSAYTGKEAAAVATMYQKVEDLEEYADDEFGDENDGITRQDIETYVDQAAASPDQTTDGINNLYQSSESKISGSANTLFPAGVNGISVSNVRQGQIGDCSFLAAVGSLANTPAGRQKIQNMITDNGNGTYSVTFPGRAAVTVNAPTQAEMGLYTSGQNGLWLPVLEKAFAQVNHNENGSSNENPYQDINGVAMERAVSVLTGHSANEDDLVFTSYDTMRSRIGDALTNGRLVTASIRANMPLTTPERSNGLPMDHAYTVLAYNATTDQITLRNPWGHGEPRNAAGQVADGNDDGTFTMSLSDFNSYFNVLCYEEAQ